MAQTIHMYPAPEGGWVIKRAGADRDSGHFNTSGEAKNFGRQLSQELEAEFVMHNLDGTITREK